MKKFILSVGAAAILASTSIAGMTNIPTASAQQTVPSIFLPMVQAWQPAQSHQGDGHQHAPDRNRPDDGSFAHPDLGTGKQIFDSSNFRIHYTLQGQHAVAATDNNGNGTPDYVEQVVNALENSRNMSINQFGWAEPPSDGNWGGNSLYDVYL